jgi:two-component system, OmpR family, response regulator
VHLLVVDDDAEFCDLLVRSLTRDGHVVRSCASVTAARRALTEAQPDLAVLDIALPDGSGIDLCRELRMESNPIPVLMLTAHSEVAVRVDCFAAGADDFLAKPFAVAELRARVRALGRRRPSGARTFIFNQGDFSLDFSARRAQIGRKSVELTAREWVVLEMLASSHGRVVSRAELLNQGWGEKTSRAAASLEVLIGRIRRKLGSELIRTVRSEGYSLDTV